MLKKFYNKKPRTTKLTTTKTNNILITTKMVLQNLITMEKEFIPYELAITLNEIGFDEPCFGYYLTNLLTNEVKLFIDDRKGFSSFEKTTPAPIFSQVFRFFREEHKLSCSIELTDNSRHYYFDFTIYDSKNREYNDEDCFDSCRRTYDNRKYGKYEEAELECLKKLIEIVKNK